MNETSEPKNTVADPELSSLESLFAPRGRRYKTVTLPVSDCNVRIQSVTEGEKSDFEAEVAMATGGNRKERLKQARIKYIGMCVVDAGGNRCLTAAHLKAMMDWDSADTDHLYDECAAHTGMKHEGIDNLEDLAKN
jgi:hypothetical protein